MLAKMEKALDGWDERGYRAKPPGYFEGARKDYVSELPVNPQASILEIGCGDGGTGYLALKEGKCGRPSQQRGRQPRRERHPRTTANTEPHLTTPICSALHAVAVNDAYESFNTNTSHNHYITDQNCVDTPSLVLL